MKCTHNNILSQHACNLQTYLYILSISVVLYTNIYHAFFLTNKKNVFSLHSIFAKYWQLQNFYNYATHKKAITPLLILFKGSRNGLIVILKKILKLATHRKKVKSTYVKEWARGPRVQTNMPLHLA